MQIVQQPLSATESGWRYDWRSQEQQCATPYGVRLTVHNADTCAVVELHSQPDGTCLLLIADERASGGDTDPAYVELLKSVCTFIRQHNLTSGLRCLLPEGDAVGLVLLDNGFRKAELLNSYRRKTTAEFFACELADIAICFASAEHLLSGQPVWTWLDSGNDELFAAESSSDLLQTLLNEILSNAQDAPSLPIPTAQELFRLWKLISADVRVSVAIRNGVPVGIAVLNLDSSPNEVVVEYIGVHPDWRRQAIGRTLLSMAISSAASLALPSQQAIVVTASESNVPACELYRKSGFELTGRMQLWTGNGQTDLK